jgi:hypothetical protein
MPTCARGLECVEGQEHHRIRHQACCNTDEPGGLREWELPACGLGWWRWCRQEHQRGVRAYEFTPPASQPVDSPRSADVPLRLRLRHDTQRRRPAGAEAACGSAGGPPARAGRLEGCCTLGTSCQLHCEVGWAARAGAREMICGTRVITQVAHAEAANGERVGCWAAVLEVQLSSNEAWWQAMRRGENRSGGA